LRIHGISFERRVDAGLTEFLIPATSDGLPVTIGHSHQVHLWLEVDGSWRVDTVEDDLEGLLDEWRDLINLGRQIAAGLTAPPSADSGVEVWWASSDYGLRRVGAGTVSRTLRERILDIFRRA
jgi:hypothetical protein